jgi:hypothetical protein
VSGREKRKSIGDKENIDVTNTPKSAVKIEDKSCNSIIGGSGILKPNEEKVQNLASEIEAANHKIDLLE